MSRDDRRYPPAKGWRSNLWQSWAVTWYDTLKDAVNEMTEGGGTLNEVMRYFGRMWLAPFDPLYTVLNPDVAQKTAETHGLNWLETIVKETAHIARKGTPQMCDETAFEVGKTVGYSKGQVVYRTEQFELIQYDPTTPDVYKVPILAVAPTISKAYALDLAADKGMSFVRTALDAGLQVFVISWRNFQKPEPYNYESYVLSVVDAMLQVRLITGQAKINPIGFCAGGQLLQTALAYMKAAEGNLDNFPSFSLGVTQTVFREDPGMLALFNIPGLMEFAMAVDALGIILPVQMMSANFALMRPDELWFDLLHRDTLGIDPPKNEVLFWNADGTRMVPALHGDYIRISKTNGFQDGMWIKGHFVKNSDLDGVDSWDVGGKTDHITRIRSEYRSALVHSPHLHIGEHIHAETHTGHVQTLALPDGPRMKLWIGPMKSTFDEWESSAEFVQGKSWIGPWTEWVTKRAGKLIPARSVSAKLGIPAPGEYVK